MAFEFKQGESIPKGVRRIVCKRIDKALKRLNGKQQAVSDSAVHDARKRFKEIRGTLRPVRDELGNKVFRRENQTFRDAGRPLSALRDAKPGYSWRSSTSGGKRFRRKRSRLEKNDMRRRPTNSCDD